MKILFVSAVFPYPLYSGGQIRIYNLLKRLSRKHDITLLSFIRKEEEETYKKEIQFCQSVIAVKRGKAWQPHYVMRAITGSYPLLLSTYDNKGMRQHIKTELEKGTYDLVHLEPGYVWPSLPQVDIPIVVSEHNIEHEVYREYARKFRIPFLRPFLLFDVKKLHAWEEKIWKAADRITAVSQEDQTFIASIVDAKKVSVVENGVDLSSFPFVPKQGTMSEAITFLYVGNFAWIQNQDAVEYLLKELWPAIIKKYPRAQLRIVGKNLSDSLRQLGNISGVYFLEHVDVIQKELQRADIMLAPIRVGGGTKYKLLEAMASGLPIITTSHGAEGLLQKDKQVMCIADNIGGVLEAIDVLRVEKKRKSIVVSARAMIEKSYSWEGIAEKLDTVWKGAYGKSH
jgi:glycosyltransferase involved in cell wall biosynthesis